MVISLFRLARTEIRGRMLARFSEIRSTLVIPRAEIMAGLVKIRSTLVIAGPEVFAIATLVKFLEILFAVVPAVLEILFAVVHAVLEILLAMFHAVFHILTGMWPVGTLEIRLLAAGEFGAWRGCLGLGAHHAAIAQSQAQGSRQKQNG